MKLRILFITVFLSISMAGMSQAMWILIFGDKLSNERMQSGINVSAGTVNYIGLPEAHFAVNWAIGGFSEIRLSKKSLFFAFDFTVKSPLGASNLNSYFPDVIQDTSLLEKQNIVLDNVAFSLPLYLKYKTKYFGFGTGPQLSYIYKSTLRYNAETTSGKDILVKSEAKSYINKFDVGWFAMAEFFLTPNHPKTSLRLGARYFIGFMEPLKSQSKVNNSNFMFTLGIPIGGKEKLPDK